MYGYLVLEWDFVLHVTTVHTTVIPTQTCMHGGVKQYIVTCTLALKAPNQIIYMKHYNFIHMTMGTAASLLIMHVNVMHLIFLPAMLYQ